MEIPGVGQYVSFTDTEGNRVSMLQPREGAYARRAVDAEVEKTTKLNTYLNFDGNAEEAF